ncbi:MAG: hypothetical protein HYZ75_08500 [Elusimicrobia bacterium]|nr:hypothetical protein [Elusimicrobiota bacterium]
MTSSAKGRPWYAGFQLVGGAAFGVAKDLRSRRMGGLIPVMIALYMAGIVLYFINLVSPLAPFVYSLF